MIICFDVDGTLIDFNDNPNYGLISVLKWFHANGDRVIIWSGGGKNYAAMWGGRLGLDKFVFAYAAKDMETTALLNPDLTFDDSIVVLGKVNCKLQNGETYPENW